MNELKKLAIELYKPPFRHIHGYIYDTDSRMVADDSALRVRGWGRIQYMDDAEALQDAAGELIAEALTEYWQRRTQPEATKPAPIPGLPFADLATPIKEFEARKAAALASPADALVAGDRETAKDAALYREIRKWNPKQFTDAWARALSGKIAFDELVNAAIQAQKDGHG